MISMEGEHRALSRERADAEQEHGAWTASTGDDEINGLGAFAFFVRLDVESDVLTLVQRFQPGALDGRDVYEHVTATVVRFDETVPALAVEELHHPVHCHREAPSP